MTSTIVDCPGFDAEPDETIDPTYCQEAPLARFLEILIYQAVKDKAASIYFEKFPDKFQITYKINGVLQEMAPPPKHLFEGVYEQTKLLFGVLKEQQMPRSLWQRITGQTPQAKRVPAREFSYEDIASKKVRVSGQSVNLNLTRLPNDNGFHIELFDDKRTEMVLDERIEDLLNKTGLLLLSSMPDEGKTTTAYNMLNYRAYKAKQIGTIVAVEQKASYTPHNIRVLARPQQPDYEHVLQAVRNCNPGTILFDDVSDPRTAREAIYHSMRGALVIAAITSDRSTTGFEYFTELCGDREKALQQLIASVHQKLIRPAIEIEDPKVDYTIMFPGQLRAA